LAVEAAATVVVAVGPDKGIGIWYNSYSTLQNPISFAVLRMMLVAQFGQRK